MFIVKVKADHLVAELNYSFDPGREYTVIQMTIKDGHQGTPPHAWFLILDDKGQPALLPDIDLIVVNGADMIRLAQLQEQAARLQIEAVQQAAAGAGLFIAPPKPRLV